MCGGVPELVEPGQSGWLVPAGSAEALGQAMGEALLALVARLEEMGERGRQRVLKRHDLSAQVGRLAELFGRAIRNESA
jgi:glycosyltransferase involved in cell wall biosynthesis